MEFLQMSGDLSAAGCAPVEVIVGEKECRGIRAVGIALELGLRGLEPARVIKPQDGSDRDEVIFLTDLVSADCPAEVVAKEAFQITEEIPAISLVADGEVLCHAF